MSRKERLGLDFYSIDTDLFLNRKIKRLIKNLGGNGYLIYSFILTEIYRDKGCFIVWDQDTAFDVSDTLNVKETLVHEVVNYCCSASLFNKELLSSESVLTTKNIQEFWTKVAKGAKRKTTKVPDKYCLISEESTAEEESITAEEGFITVKRVGSTQSKVKKSKVKKSKEEEEESDDDNIFELLETLKTRYLNSEKLIQAVLSVKKNKLQTKVQIDTRLGEFNDELKSKSIFQKPWNDYTSHFLNWHRKNAVDQQPRQKIEIG